MRIKSFTRVLSDSLCSSFRYDIDKRLPQLMLMYMCLFRTCINPSLIVHCVLYMSNDYGYVITCRSFRVS